MLFNNVNFSGGFSITAGAPISGPVTDGLIMQLDADSSASYPGTGVTVNDLTGNYTHTLNDATMFKNVSGIKYFEFGAGGTSKTMFVNGTGPTLNAGGWTYSIWARLVGSTTLTNRYLVSGRVGSTITYRPAIRISSASLLSLQNNAGGVIACSPSYNESNIRNLWRQITVTNIDSTGATKFYVNSTLVGTATAPSGGNNHYGFGANSNWGDVANCLLYNKVLSDSEVLQNFNFYKSRFGIS